MHLTVDIGGWLPYLGEAASTDGGCWVGGISTTGKREGDGNCTDQTGTVTQVSSALVCNAFLWIFWSILLFIDNRFLSWNILCQFLPVDKICCLWVSALLWWLWLWSDSVCLHFPVIFFCIKFHCLCPFGLLTLLAGWQHGHLMWKSVLKHFQKVYIWVRPNMELLWRGRPGKQKL